MSYKLISINKYDFSFELRILEKQNMRSEDEILNVFVSVADCRSDEDESCPFIGMCECTDEDCRNQFKEWLDM